MIIARPLLAGFFLLLLLSACDRPADPNTKQESNAPVARGESPKPALIDSTPYFEFENDAAFAKYAASLEPSLRRIAPSWGVSANQYVRDGNVVIGYRDSKGAYLLWTRDPKSDVYTASYLDQERGEPKERDSDISSASWYTEIAPDGSWGFFVCPLEGSNVRGELWRLPANPSEKPDRFHAFAEMPSSDMGSATISSDGRWLLCTIAKAPALFAVDAAAGKIESIPLSIPADLLTTATQRVFLKLCGPGLKLSINRTGGIDKKIGGLEHSLAIATLQVTDNPRGAQITDLHWLPAKTPDARGVIAISPDGRLFVTHTYYSDVDEPSTLWRWPEKAGDAPSVVTMLPPATAGSDPPVAWSRDGRRMAIETDGSVHIFNTSDLPEFKPIHSARLKWCASQLGFTDDGTKVIALCRNGFITTIPLDQPREIYARIGESRIEWTVPKLEPVAKNWPALRTDAQVKHPDGSAPSTLIAEIGNEGSGTAEQVRAVLTVAPPLVPRLASPEPAATAVAPIATVGTLHFGTIRQTNRFKRFLDLPNDPELFNRARRFTLTVTSKFGFDPAPLHWLHLPRTLESEENYHKLARRIFDAASQSLAEARDVPWKEPLQLVPMGPSGFGFSVGFATIVRYQNPFQMNETALRVNRAVMQVDSHDDLMRHGEMMLYWYLPHELVHCGDHRTGWATEFVANTIQPYLTAKILEKMEDAPFTAESMSYIYDRYVEVLRPHLKPQEIARVERFIQSNGEGERPWDMSANELFESNTPAYVYFGARINQHSWAKQSKLEVLCKQYLPQVKEPAEKE